MRHGERQAGAVATRQAPFLPGGAAPPHRAHRVDDEARRQIVAAGEPRLARRAAAEPVAFGKQSRPGGAMDGTVDAAAAEQRAVGGVDDGVNGKLGDVAHRQFNPWIIAHRSSARRRSGNPVRALPLPFGCPVTRPAS